MQPLENVHSLKQERLMEIDYYFAFYFLEYFTA